MKLLREDICNGHVVPSLLDNRVTVYDGSQLPIRLHPLDLISMCRTLEDGILRQSAKSEGLIMGYTWNKEWRRLRKAGLK